MARRKDSVAKWLELAIGMDTTRPFLLKPAISADNPDLRVCSDGHRLHVTSSKHYTVEITNDWKSPTDMVFNPPGGFKFVKQFNRDFLLEAIGQEIDENLNKKLLDQLSWLKESSNLFSEIKCTTHRDTLEESIKDTLAILREYRIPKSPISLERFLGVNIHVNPQYLLDALSYNHSNVVFHVNGELDPLIIKYLDIKFAACIMPMRH